MSKKLRQKFKYLENEKSFEHEIKNNFISFEVLLLKKIKKAFLEGESPTLIHNSARQNFNFLLQKNIKNFSENTGQNMSY